ncbi:hypothetical protein V3C99_007892 [Haemonchus contortus]
MIFRQSPDTKQLFPFMNIRKPGDAKRSREMEFHGLRFMQVLESVVKSIDNPTTLDPLCDNLGRVHGRLIDSRGFKAHHWSVFIECTLFHFREVLGSAPSFSSEATMDRAIIVWRSVLRIIIKRMKVGLASDLLNRQANRIAEEPSTSERSSPVANITSTIPHALTLPIINGNNKASHQTRQDLLGLFRPLRNFARRRIVGRQTDATSNLHRHN